MTEVSEEEIDKGSFKGTQLATTYPVFWIWRPKAVSQEYWILYKPNQTGGFQMPSSTFTSASWQIDFEGAIAHGDSCDFMDWVVANYNVDPCDLEMLCHDITPVTCPTT